MMMGLIGEQIIPVTGWTGPTSGLTHQWPMDSGHISGSTVSDIIGSNNGTINGSASNIAGPSGQFFGSNAISFSGAGDVGVSQPWPGTFASNAHSWFSWVNIVDPSAQGGGAFSQRITNLAFDANNAVAIVNQDVNPGGLVVSFILAGVNVGLVASGAFNTVFVANTWEHVGYTWDGISTLVLYANGSACTTSSETGFGVQNNDLFATRDASFNGGLTGALYNTVIYNRVLSSGEVTTLFGAK